MTRAGAFLAAAFLGLASAGAAELPIASATLSPPELSAGAEALLRIEIGGTFRVAAAPVLPLTNLTVESGPSIENRFEWINGRSSSRTVLTWRVRAGSPGKAAVGPIRLVDESGRAVTTAPIAAEVGAGPAEPETAPEAQGDPALVARIEPASPCVGQQAIWTLYLVTRGQATRGEVEALPDFRGFWAEDLEREANVQPQVWNVRGALWRAYPMVRKALFPNRAGKLAIGPARARVAVRESVFDIFDSPFGDASPVERASAPITIAVRPSPAPGLPVGHFALKSSLDRPRTVAGEPIAVSAQLSGDGRLADVAPPALVVPGARVSEPESRLAIRRTTSRLTATRTWEWVVTPDHPGTLAIPPLSISTLDPGSGRAVVVRSGALRAAVDPPAPPAPAPAPIPAAIPARSGIPPAAAAGAGGAAAALLLLGFWIGRRRAARPATAEEGRASLPAGADIDRILDALEAAAARRGGDAAARVAEWRRRRDEIRFAPHFSNRDDAAAALEEEVRRAAAREL